MFSFCNEQLTDGNSLTWYKCKNKTEQFKNREKGEKIWTATHQARLWYSKHVQVLRKVKKLMFQSRNKNEKKTTNEWTNIQMVELCLLFGTWLLFTIL